MKSVSGEMTAAAARRERRTGVALLLALLLAYGYFVPRGPYHNPDSRLALTYSVVERGVIDIDPYAATTEDRAAAGSHYYTDKAPGISLLLTVPYAALLRFAGGWLEALGQGPGSSDRFVVRYLLTFAVVGASNALFAVALFHWLRRTWAPVGPRLAVALGYALGSPALVFSTAAFGHVPAGICLFAAWMLTCEAAPRRLAAAGALLGLAVALEYPAALPAAVIAAGTVWGGRRVASGRGSVAVARMALGAAPWLVALAAYQTAAFGAPWQVGYAHLLPDTAFAAGQAQGLLGVRWPRPAVVLELLAGAKRGLALYAPWLVLAAPGAALLWRRGVRREVVVAAGAFASLLAVNAGYVFWDGGASWGPRHLVPALPFLALLALPAAARWPRLTWSLVAAGVVANLAALATRSLPESAVAFPLRDTLLPRVLAASVENNWGMVVGLDGWRALVPLLGAWTGLAAWASGLRRSYGWALAAGWALGAAATLNRTYLDYAEGYYLYLGSRIAAGARLYADAASTQPPLLPAAVALLWRVQPDVYLPRLLALACAVLAAVLAGRLAERTWPDRGLGPPATALAALLPLGAGTPQLLDANAVLAPLGPLLCLCWLGTAGPRRRALAAAFTAGVVGAVGLATKLTFAPFAAQPLLLVLLLSRLGQMDVGDGARACRRQRSSRAALAWPWRALAPWGQCEAPAGAGVPEQGCQPPSGGHPAVAWSSRADWRLGAAYAAGLGAGIGASVARWGLPAGAAALDGVLGELGSPLQPLGAGLAYAQLVALAGPVLVFAVGGWLAARRAGAPPLVLGCGAAGALLPLLAAHHGTYLGVARPAEPFLAVFATFGCAQAAARLARPRGTAWRGHRLPVQAAVVAAAALTLLAGRPWLTWRGGAPPDTVVTWLASAPDGAGDGVLAPPYYAALAGRRMAFDYADWTVLGMRAHGGMARERALAAQLVDHAERAGLGTVLADFRLGYVPELEAALAARYATVDEDGDVRARSVRRLVPR